MGQYNPGYLSAKETREEAVKKDVEPKTLWDSREAIFMMENGWFIERIRTQKDAMRMTTRLGGCWGTNIWPAQEAGTMMMFKMCKEDGTLMGGITLGTTGKSAYSSCDDLKVGVRSQKPGDYTIKREPMTFDHKKWDVLEVLAIPGFNIYDVSSQPAYYPGAYGPVNDKIRAMVRKWYDACLEE